MKSPKRDGPALVRSSVPGLPLVLQRGPARALSQRIMISKALLVSRSSPVGAALCRLFPLRKLPVVARERIPEPKRCRKWFFSIKLLKLQIYTDFENKFYLFTTSLQVIPRLIHRCGYLIQFNGNWAYPSLVNLVRLGTTAGMPTLSEIVESEIVESGIVDVEIR